MGAVAAFGFVHHMIAGPNKVSAEDEANARRLAGGES